MALHALSDPRVRWSALTLSIALLALLVFAAAASGSTAPPTETAGDWLVGSDTMIEGGEVSVGGDLVVLTGSELVLRECTLEFVGDADHELVVEKGASLRLEGATVSTDREDSLFAFDVYGSAQLLASDISRMRGGVHAHSDGLEVLDCSIHHGEGPGIELDGHSATISGCTIDEVDIGVRSMMMGEPGDSVQAADGWDFSLSDSTITSKTYGVYLYWKKSLSGTLDLDFKTTLTNVDISRSSKDGIHCYVDLYVNRGSGVLDELFDFTMTGGSSDRNGGSGLYVYHYIKPYYLNGRITSESRISLTDASFSSNSLHGIDLEDTLHVDRGSAPSVTHRQGLTLTDCRVNSNQKSGVYLNRPRTIYYAYGTGQKARTTTLTLAGTEVKSNVEYGVYAYDNHYAYGSKGKFVWTNTVRLQSSTVEANGQDGVYSNLYERLYYGDKSGVDYRQTFDFSDSTLAKNGRNGFDLTTTGYMYYHGTMVFRNDLNVARSRIHNNTGLGGYAYFYVYGYDWQYTFHRRGAYTVEGSFIEDNQGGGLYARTYGYSYRQTCDVTLRCRENQVRGNGADRALGFEGMTGNTGEALVTGNLVEKNGGAGGTTTVDLIYFSQFVVYDNTFRNNTHHSTVRCYAYNMQGPSPNVGPKYNNWVQVYENVFDDCNTGATASSGAIYIDSGSGKGSMLVKDNVVRNSGGNAVATYRMRGPGAIYVQDNTFEGVGGSGVSIANSYSGAVAVVSNNVLTNGTGSAQNAVVLIKDDGGSTVTVEDNSAEGSTLAGVVSSGSRGPRSLTVRSNRLVGLGGNAIDMVGSGFVVEGNNLSDCKGFAIALRGFTSLPTVGKNLIERAENGLLLEAKERTDGLRLKIHMDNVTWNVNETAIMTNHLDLVVTNSSLSGRKALHASDGTITAISTQVPYMGGGTGPEGNVEVFYMMGLNLTWANATGSDSGLPASDALVVFRRSTGGYFTSRIVDRRGYMPAELLPSWKIIEGHTDRMSPYDLEITASGLVTHATLRVDEDRQARVSVVDWSLPSITVEKPYDGALVNTGDLIVKGFLSEVGSGLDGAWVSLDGTAWNEVEPLQIWEAQFDGLEHGSARIHAKARDRSGNVNVTSISFELDLRGPDLEIITPLDSTRTRDSEITVEALTELDAELFLDGEPVLNRRGQLFERYTLTQGLNIIVVEAVDDSGNAAIEILRVWLDTQPPALFISSPKEGEVAAQALITVTGRTESMANLTINGVEAMVGEDGWFSLSYLLTSRENLLAIESTDRAGNVNTTYRHVTLDDRPPEFQILRPTEGTLTSATEIEVEGSVGQDDLDALVYVGGERVEHVGRFTSTVVLEEGENRVEVRAVDPNGRESVTIVHVFRDTVPPVLVLTEPPSPTWITRHGTLTLSGVAGTATSLALDLMPYELEADGSFTIEHQLDAGPNTLELTAIDAAGNEDTIILHVTWDASPPVLNLDSVPPTTQAESLMLSGTTEGVTVTVNGVPLPVRDSSFSVPLNLVVGHNTFVVAAMDEAGNEASVRIEVERVPAGDVQAKGIELNLPLLVPLLAAVAALAATSVLLRRPSRAPPKGRLGNGRSRRPPGGGPRTRPEEGSPGTGPPSQEPVIVDLPPEEMPAEPPAPVEGAVEPGPEPEVEAPLEPEAEGRTSESELELEFASVPLYSVPDPAKVGGVVEVNGDGSFTSPESPLAGGEQVAEGELETPGTTENEPEHEEGPYHIRGASTGPVEEPVAAPGPETVPGPEPVPEPAPRPVPARGSEPVSEHPPRPVPARGPEPGSEAEVIHGPPAEPDTPSEPETEDLPAPEADATDPSVPVHDDVEATRPGMSTSFSETIIAAARVGTYPTGDEVEGSREIVVVPATGQKVVDIAPTSQETVGTEDRPEGPSIGQGTAEKEDKPPASPSTSQETLEKEDEPPEGPSVGQGTAVAAIEPEGPGEEEANARRGVRLMADTNGDAPRPVPAPRRGPGPVWKPTFKSRLFSGGNPSRPGGDVQEEPKELKEQERRSKREKGTTDLDDLLDELEINYDDEE